MDQTLRYTHQTKPNQTKPIQISTKQGIGKEINHSDEENINDIVYVQPITYLPSVHSPITFQIPVVMSLDAFFAGIDTTSSSAAFLIYNLAANPDVQDRLYAEIEVRSS